MKSLHDQIAGRCKHFTGMMNKTCEAGVSYDTVKVQKPDGGRSFACIEKYSHEPEATCDKRKWPTEEEVAAKIAEIDVRWKMMELAAPLIRKIKTEHKGKSWGGAVDCPACKGALHMSHSSYNGHVHGRCETDGCLGWME